MSAPPIRVAIVGAGPAGLYALGHLLDNRDQTFEVDLIERLPTPWGLVRAGVAPDHAEKKQIADRLFDFTLRDPRVRFLGNVAVGTDVQVAELAEWYDAVIFAQGAGAFNRIGIPGEDLPGVWGARDFVQFYNGHPDQAHLPFDLSHHRAIIVGNGNVALDAARMLTMDIPALEKTDISDTALRLLRGSKVREVVVMGRRDLQFAAFNNPELEELAHRTEIDVAATGQIEPPLQNPDNVESWRARRRYQIMADLLARPPRPGKKRIVFHFLATPVALRGNHRVESLEFVTNHRVTDGDAVRFERGTNIEAMQTGLVLSACGYRGKALPGLPFDEAAGIIPNRNGRVLHDGRALPGIYVTGWIKRGCRGIIGSNRRCAQETVDALLADLGSGLLTGHSVSSDDVLATLSRRIPQIVLYDNWRAIDRAERLAGRNADRPRIKLTQTSELLDTAALG